jgi:hypothetical protein
MRQGDTKLVEQCRYTVRRPNEVCLDGPFSVVHGPLQGRREEGQRTMDEFLTQPAYIPHRPKKNPRDLKILDPACGSGHFLL